MEKVKTPYGIGFIKATTTKDIGGGKKHKVVDEKGEKIWNGDFLYFPDSLIEKINS